MIVNYNQKLGLFTLLLVSIFLTACKKEFLETDPKGRLIAKKIQDYELLLNGRTLQARASQIVMSDEVAGFEPLFSVGNTGVPWADDLRAFAWEDDIYIDPLANDEYLTISMSLYASNKIINEVMDAEGGTVAQKQSIRAEAQAIRAFLYFQLVNYYGKPYAKETSGTDLSVPIIKQADVTQTKFERATVQAVYELIESDLKEAIPALPSYISHRVRMSKTTADALLGKVYVHMGRFDEAIPHLEASLEGFTKASIPVGLYDFQKELAPGGSFFPNMPPMGPSRMQNVYADREIMFLNQTLSFYVFASGGIVLSPETVGLYAQSDRRLDFSVGLPFPSIPGAVPPYPLGMRRGWGRSGVVSVGINAPDVYLLLAECKARKGELGSAVTQLEYLRKNRMSGTDAQIPTAIAGNEQELVRFILDERIREFALLGERWFDMRRLSVDPIYSNMVKYQHLVYNQDGTVARTYTLKPERLTFRLPIGITQTNPELPQNP